MTALDSAKLDDARKAGDRLRFGATETVPATEVTGVGFNYNRGDGDGGVGVPGVLWCHGMQ